MTSDKNTKKSAGGKREYKRHPKRFRTRYREAEGGWHTAFTKDVSVSGLFIISTRLPQTRQVEIEIEVSKQRTVTLSGVPRHGSRVPPRMARLIKGGFGVKIVQAPPDWYEYCLELDR